MVEARSRPAWYSQAVIYAIDVGSYRDSNADGVGDLAGVRQALPYLQRLGIDCIWLLPFFATENRDNGYDVTDYYAVDPQFGTFGDFGDLVDEAEQRGIRIVIDLVVNHTSDRHPWFQAARSRDASPYRDYYIWNDQPPPLPEQPPSIFPDRVPSVWTWDEQRGSFYYHQFYPFQPALNHLNPDVRDEVRRIIAFWLRLGVAGFRLDAASHLIDPPLDGERADRVEILREYRRHVVKGRGDAILIGEADLPEKDLEPLMGEHALQLLFNFVLNGHAFLAMARGSAEPIVEAIGRLPHPADAGWANFLRNLDEVDLERLTDAEREEVFAAFAPDEGMRIFNRGIRRRLASMLDGDQRRLELAYAILLALPGAPVIVYGDEIGMGDDQSLPEREAVRTAMQWTSGTRAGFTTADTDRRSVKVISGGRFGAERVNVADQENDSGSLLRWLEEAIRVRRATPELVAGGAEVKALGDGAVLARRCELDGVRVVALHNLAGHQVSLSRDELGLEAGPVQRLLADGRSPDPTAGKRAVRLAPYGYLWLRMGWSDEEAR
jgi:maltose alpha-D-glucosyltransferase / alpha-amylase